MVLKHEAGIKNHAVRHPFDLCFLLPASVVESLLEYALFLIGERMLGGAAPDLFGVDPHALAGVQTGKDDAGVLAIKEGQGKALVPARMLERVETHEADLLDGYVPDRLERGYARYNPIEPLLDLCSAAEDALEYIARWLGALSEYIRPSAIEVEYQPGDDQQDRAESGGEGNERMQEKVVHGFSTGGGGEIRPASIGGERI